VLIAPQLRQWIRSSILKSRPRRRKPRDTASRFIARRKLGSPELLEDRTLLAAALVGVDFGDNSLALAPTNWGVVQDVRGGLSAADLLREDNTNTAIDLTVATNSFANSSFEGQANGATVNAATVPIHTNSLALTDGFVLNFDLAGVITATWSDLTPAALYEVYVFALEAGGFDALQHVAIVGSNTVEFDQSVTIDGNLHVNRQQGSSSRNLSDDAEFVAADSSGNITITISANNGG
jgi:hypothetical protein